MFEGLKIPRAHAPITATVSSSSSEDHVISDTLPSDYPSESHSEIEDTRSLPASSAGSFDNKAFVNDNSSYYSENCDKPHLPILETFSRIPIEHHKFDIQVKVKKPTFSAASLKASDTDSSFTNSVKNLSTILEQKEESYKSNDSPLVAENLQFSYVPEIHQLPKHIQQAPTFSKILRKQQETQESSWGTRPLKDVANESALEVSTLPISSSITTNEYAVDIFKTVEPPISALHKPEITSHMVDDVFLRTITEKITVEDIEKHKRLITEYHTKPYVKDRMWDVIIKNYPENLREQPQWENFSDISSVSGLSHVSKPEIVTHHISVPNSIGSKKNPLYSPELVSNVTSQRSNLDTNDYYLKTFNVPLVNKDIPNWDILIQVLKPHDQEEDLVIENAEIFNSQLTHADRIKWRQIITTESSLRTLLTEATAKEDFERIRYDKRYEKFFEPSKWDVIIKILTPTDKFKSPPKYKKKSDCDNRSRRSSLPTLYEYDSDGSIKNSTNEMEVRTKKFAHSSYKSEADLRSLSEVTIDFGRPEVADSHSESSSYYPRYYNESEREGEIKIRSCQPSIARSLSQPSLARSASEFTERWVAPLRYDTASELTSLEGTPKLHRSDKSFRETTENIEVWEQTSHGDMQTNLIPRMSWYSQE